MLVSEVIDRTLNEWLFPSGINRPAYDKLAAPGIDGVTLTIPLTGRLTSIPRDSTLEIESELILVDSVSGTTVTAKERGWLETGGVAHATGSIVWLDPTFHRKAIFNALVSVVGLLYPASVYARKIDSTTTFSYSTPTKTLPAGGTKIIAITVRTSLTTPERWNPLRKGIDYVEHLEFSPPKYELMRGGVEGGAMQVVYQSDFTLPSSETEELNNLASPIPASLQPYLPQGIVGHLLQGREVPRVQIEEVRRLLAAQGIQVGATLNVGDALLSRFMSRYVAAERDRLKKTDSMGIEITRR